MKKAIEHKVQAQIKSESPEIVLEVIYQDDFTNDHYVLKSSGNKDTKLMNFDISKNGKDLQTIKMQERNVNSFLNEFLSITKDADFNSEFQSKIYNISAKQITDFFDFFDTSIIRESFTLEGEMKRMQKIAGIIKG